MPEYQYIHKVRWFSQDGQRRSLLYFENCVFFLLSGLLFQEFGFHKGKSLQLKQKGCHLACSLGIHSSCGGARGMLCRPEESGSGSRGDQHVPACCLCEATCCRLPTARQTDLSGKVPPPQWPATISQNIRTEGPLRILNMLVPWLTGRQAAAHEETGMRSSRTSGEKRALRKTG